MFPQPLSPWCEDDREAAHTMFEQHSICSILCTTCLSSFAPSRLASFPCSPHWLAAAAYTALSTVLCTLLPSGIHMCRYACLHCKLTDPWALVPGVRPMRPHGHASRQAGQCSTHCCACTPCPWHTSCIHQRHMLHTHPCTHAPACVLPSHNCMHFGCDLAHITCTLQRVGCSNTQVRHWSQHWP